jgi:hypothetical protein
MRCVDRYRSTATELQTVVSSASGRRVVVLRYYCHIRVFDPILFAMRGGGGEEGEEKEGGKGMWGGYAGELVV